MVTEQLANRHEILAVVTRDLLDLCDVLEQHFAVEEGVVASSALARGGGAHISLTSLRGDHRRILARLRHLADRLGHADDRDR